VLAWTEYEWRRHDSNGKVHAFFRFLDFISFLNEHIFEIFTPSQAHDFRSDIWLYLLSSTDGLSLDSGEGRGRMRWTKTREQTVRAVETRPFRSKCGREMLESSPATLFYYPRLEHSEKFTCSLQISQSWFLILPFAKMYKKIFKKLFLNWEHSFFKTVQVHFGYNVLNIRTKWCEEKS